MSEMSPLEKYHDLKRSGNYTHPKTLENWPDKPKENSSINEEKEEDVRKDTKIEEPVLEAPWVSRELFYKKLDEMRSEAKERITILDKDLDRLDTHHAKQHESQRSINIIIFVLLIGLIVAVFALHQSKDEKEVVFKEAPPRVVTKTEYKMKYKTKWKTKTIIPTEYKVARENLATAYERINLLVASNKRMRRKLCFQYDSWLECQPYKKTP